MLDDHPIRYNWRWQLTAITALALLLGLLFQGNRSLWGTDEGRYTNIALQMLESGNWLIPHRHPDHEHLSKPPLTYWAIAASLAAFGNKEWAARLPSALAYIGTTLLVFALAWRLLPERPWLPPLIYATSLLPFLAGNIINTDYLLTLFETLAVYGFVAMLQAPDRASERAWRTVMWAAFGLGFLTKGPPALVPLLAIVAFRYWCGVGRDRPVFTLGGSTLFALVGVSWYALLIAQRPELWAYFVGYEVYGRIFTAIHDRNAVWWGWIEVYVPVLLLGTLPWSIAFWARVRALAAAARKLRQPTYRKLHQEKVFVLLWLVLPLLVFCLARSRLPLYILPLFVPIALGLGALLEDWRPTRLWGALLALWVSALLVLKGAAAGFPHGRDARALAEEIARHFGPHPGEVVFVGETPMYGLRFYLGSHVLRLGFDRQRNVYYDGVVTDQLRPGRADPRPFIVHRREREQFEALVGKFGLMGVAVGRFDDYELFRLTPAPRPESPPRRLPGTDA